LRRGTAGSLSKNEEEELKLESESTLMTSRLSSFIEESDLMDLDMTAGERNSVIC